MKKITTLLFALTIALTTFGQNDPISQSWQQKFFTVTLPLYASGGFTPIVRNNTTGQMQRCNELASKHYADSESAANANSLNVGNPIIGGTTHGVLYQNYQDKLSNGSNWTYNNYYGRWEFKHGGIRWFDINTPNADSTAAITLSAASVQLNRTYTIISNVPTYANDTTAMNAGLTKGMLYKTTTGVNTVLKIVP